MITYHRNIIQGSEEWLSLRRGLLTASEMRLILTPTLKAAANEKQRIHLYELAAQTISGYTEPHYTNEHTERGHEDEIYARLLYEETRGVDVEQVGFITNDRWGFTLGFSPDGLVGDSGMIECKSRLQKYQVQTAISRNVPEEYMLQIQSGLLISEREWCDFISYSAGLPMITYRVYPDARIQDAILEAAGKFYKDMAGIVGQFEYTCSLKNWPKTERKFIEGIV